MLVAGSEAKLPRHQHSYLDKLTVKIGEKGRKKKRSGSAALRFFFPPSPITVNYILVFNTVGDVREAKRGEAASLLSPPTY